MKKILLIALMLTFGRGVLEAQTVTIVSPADLTFPYEVPAGTQVTLRWEHNLAPVAFYSSPEAPVFPEFGPDEAWKEYTNFTDQGDGTYLITLTMTSPLHLFGASFSSWIGQWSYSNVVEIGIASGVKITSADGLVCPGGIDAETLQITGTYPSYQWYFNNQPIEGATASTYAAKAEGYYKVQVPLDGKPVFSSTLRISTAKIEMTGALSTAGDKLTLTASPGMSSYQWLSGPNANSLSPVSSATAVKYEATLTASQVYYAAKGVAAGCTVQSEARPASLTIFAKPTINIDAKANAFGKICEGTLMTLSVASQYETYEWYNGTDLYSAEASVKLTQGQGIFTVKVNPLYWPEIAITSAGAEVKFFAPIKPLLTGVSSTSYCPGSTINVTLSDEGYTYAWYKHTSFNYTEADKIEVPGYEYSFEFETATYLTVAARYQGCESSTRAHLDSYERALLFPELSDSEKNYLCEGSSVDIFLPEYIASEYTGFQWYALSGEEYVKKDGQTSASYTVTSPGTYVIDASPKACPAVVIRSEPTTISDYKQREFFIESEKPTLCIGETTTLTVSEEWTNIQWFEKELYISNHGYLPRYIPLSGATGTNSIVVNAFKTYLVKAKHTSCPDGLKISSQPFELLPTVNPEITPDPNTGIHRWHQAPYDSIANYLYCSEAPLTLSLPEGFVSYKWYKLQYTGDDDYAVGNEIAGEQGTSIAIKAFGAVWYTAKVESDGCIGLSRPVLIDTYVHNTPDVESRDNAELCGEGDSTLLRVAFYGDWVKYEWYRDGELIPDSDNDSIYAKVAGGYNVTGYPSSCPHIGYSSGTPAPVTEYPKATIEQNEEVIYAMPEFGFYSYQWYRDGEPIESGNDIPFVIYKKDLVPGIYTVEVTNPKECSSLSDGFLWTITGAEEDQASAIDAYPNPTTGMITITGVEKERIRSISLYDVQGQRMKPVTNLGALQIDISHQPAGVYIVEVILQNGHHKKMKVLRQ